MLSKHIKALQRTRQLCIHYDQNKRNKIKCIIINSGFLTTTKVVWDIKICRRQHAISFKLMGTVDKKSTLRGFAYLLFLDFFTIVKMKPLAPKSLTVFSI